MLSSSGEGRWKKRKGGEEEEDCEGPGGIIDPDYAHSISPSERESFWAHSAAPGLGEDSAEEQPGHQHISSIQQVKDNLLTYRRAVSTQM